MRRIKMIEDTVPINRLEIAKDTYKLMINTG
jgi:hypothetical protein